MSDLDDLIARLEAASAGSPRLGAEVLAAARSATLLSFEQYGNEIWIALEKDGERWEVKHLYNPTTSLDAAISLVPDGSDWTARTRFEHPYRGRFTAEAVIWATRTDTYAMTPALALCIAALKALNL